MRDTLTVDRIIARMLLYRFLSQAYAYPQTDFEELLLGNEVWDELKTADEVLGSQSKQVIDDLQSFVYQYATDKDKLLQEIQVEYTYLFINAVPRVPAPPYESVYSGEALLMGEPVSQVLHLYREAGLVMNESFDCLPDHISAEFEFMFYLIQQEVNASQSDAGVSKIWHQRQHEFLCQHLVQWSPLFLEKVINHARMPFYRIIAELTKEIINIEKNK